MTTKYGMFSEPPYLTPGVTYRKDPNTQGHKITEISPSNIKTTIPRSGKGKDATFDAFKPLFAKEKYTNGTPKGSEGHEKGAEQPWKAPSPMKRTSGLGDFYGTLAGRVEYIPRGEDIPPGKRSVPIERSIYTSPGKKGSYGTTKTTLSQLGNPLGVVSEYAYAAHPYRSQHEISMEEGKSERSKRMTELPFKPAGACRSKISGRGICGEYTYHPEGESARNKDDKLTGDTPFKPAGRSGVLKTIGKFPEFIPDGHPVDLRKEKRQPTGGDPWKPSSTAKTDCIRSIVRMNA